MGFHWPELFAIGMIALLIFGPRRLPEMGNALGRALGEFKKSINEVPQPPAPSEVVDSPDNPGKLT
jgi:sec-independent protein translocase protein TatA